MNRDRNELRPDEWEVVARHVDGHGEPLDPRQEKVANETRQAEAWLGSMLDVSVPQEVLEEAYRRMDAALASPRAAAPARWRLRALGLGAAVAAAVVIAVVLNSVVTVHPPTDNDSLVTAQEVVTEFLRDDTSALDLHLAVLDDEMTLILADLVLDDGLDDSSAIDSITEEFGEIWFTDPSDSSDDYEL